MSSAKPSHYRLTPKALDDLDDIWRYTAENWSIEQADDYIDSLVQIFETVVSMPALARERSEFSPPVRIHTHHDQLIIYIINGDHIIVLRVLSSRQNWQAILRRIDM